MYDIFYIGDNAGVKENYPFAKQVSDESSIKPKTTLYWLIEPNTEILDYDVQNTLLKIMTSNTNMYGSGITIIMAV